MRTAFLFFLLSLSLFAEKKELLIILGEESYQTGVTLPLFAEQTLSKDFHIKYARASKEDRHRLEGLEAIETADLVCLSIWRMAMPSEQLEKIKQYIDKGKPLVVIKTSTHGFSLRSNQPAPEGSAQWPTFDQDILGCHYTGHYSSAYMTDVRLDPKLKSTAFLNKIRPFSCRSWLYEVKPIAPDAKVYLWGTTLEGEEQPVAWTREEKGRVFCTTLGHQEDFLNQSFREVLHRSFYWAAGLKIPATMPSFKLYEGFVEKDYPFYSTMLDMSNKKENHAIPRALILNPYENIHVAFDMDMLNTALVWKGQGVSMDSMAAGSYHSEKSTKKSKQGEHNAPKPVGETVWSLPKAFGWSQGENVLQDPRAKSGLEKLKRGPIPQKQGLWEGVYHTDQGCVLSYVVYGSSVKESWLKSELGFMRRLDIQKENSDDLYLQLGTFKGEASLSEKGVLEISSGELKHHLRLRGDGASFVQDGSRYSIKVQGKGLRQIEMVYGHEKGPFSKSNQIAISIKPKVAKFWKDDISVRPMRKSQLQGMAYQYEEIPLPLLNEKRRNVRSSDLAFDSKGVAFLVTFDGDVWKMEEKGKRDLRWTRYASGLNEPQGIALRKDRVFVFCRNGLTELIDRDGNGEADFYKNFCSLPAQTLESREFAMSLEVLADGSFIIAKGGQRSHSHYRNGGAILKIAPDGSSYKEVAVGFREPYFGIDAKTEDIFASDQQGHWIPTTPFIHVKQRADYGFRHKAYLGNGEAYDEPTLYIPHQVAQSGTEVMRVHSSKMGVLNQKILYCDYSNSKLGLIDYDPKKENFTALYELQESLNFPVLKAEQHPKNGLIYLTGFQIWDSQTKRISGLCRISPDKTFSMPKRAAYFKEGIYLHFDEPIEESSLQNTSIRLERWNYLRQGRYGSALYNLEGDVGKDRVAFSSLTLSKDKTSIFVAIPNMEPCMQLKVFYSVKSVSEKSMLGHVYFTLKQLLPFDIDKFGFPKINYDAEALSLVDEKQEVSLALGLKTVTKVGCVGCHSTSEQREGKNGPPWKGLFSSTKQLNNGKSVVADAAYLKESILNPMAKVAHGYMPGMPPYAGMLSEAELDSIILYIKSLK